MTQAVPQGGGKHILCSLVYEGVKLKNLIFVYGKWNQSSPSKVISPASVCSLLVQEALFLGATNSSKNRFVCLSTCVLETCAYRTLCYLHSECVTFNLNLCVL